MQAPTHTTFDNFIRNKITTSIEQIILDINTYIFEVENVEFEHIYIDGIKIEPNADCYTWVWKKYCITNRCKEFEKLFYLIGSMNTEVLSLMNARTALYEKIAAKKQLEIEP